MLDSETRRRIDSARDILVGKVPDPKSQVEQITIALIYKFMDDIDAEAEELGGERKFFAGEFTKYGWSKLMRSGLGGHEMLSLYAEAIDKMPENPGVPPLFRSIFTNAYLPYRDPETLRMFLKEIDGFEYDHSERLGDAYEYLLSFMGSQGDAGQFRTPRHIIEFIVDIVDPKKHETILDPACGTAGFLISAYKHILESNQDESGASTLTPDESAALADNLRGYDISPDFVRLSLVNMYLHGFTGPQIVEYDTLTSEERWNEYADVILANPPFFSPKGGIRPHKRFGVQSKRSEVLFVDYIAEHLTPNGRAGIIVPEGIIFNEQEKAFRLLREMLVSEYLVAVISLPAGVFNPYSDVKTSVLVLDSQLAKSSETIGIFRVDNDGFSLGKQRYPIGGSQLSQVQEEVVVFLKCLRGELSIDDFELTHGTVVRRVSIAATRGHNLTGARYRPVRHEVSQWSHRPLDDVCNVNPDQAKPENLFQDWFNYIDISCVENLSGRFLGSIRTQVSEAPTRARRIVREGDVLLSTVRPNLRAFTHLSEVPDRAIASTGFAVLRPDLDQLLPELLVRLLHDDRTVSQMISMMEKGSYPSINQSDVESLLIPVPPLDVQREIVAEIEEYQKIIDGARAVVENYRPRIAVDPAWPVVELGEIAEVKLGKMLDKQKHTTGRLLPYLNNISLRWHQVDTSNLPEMFFEDQELDRYELKAGDVVVCEGGEPGRSAVWDGRLSPLMYQKAIHRVRFKEDFEPELLVIFLEMIAGTPEFEGLFTGSTIKHLTRESFVRLRVPVPPLPDQRAIVAEIEAERALANANRELICRFERKIETVLSRVWG